MQALLLFATTCKPTFFGLVPWYQYLKVTGSPPNCNVQSFTIFPSSGHYSDIPLVLAAIVDDLLRVAGLVALAYVLVGAIRYITSQGSPDATSKALSTLINALIGLALAVTGVAIVGFIGNQLGG